ncbi:hypothetical protein A2738_00045 [Candidatus Nomurabacteria bacterium RIFCSPHIGHO2_01_FULL_42_15]|uniref:HTH deoR-type domain-containing protein n=1 Tax=Candidatus Nomurabacteria bacterium RIFCSPHIGHO2_01_FULL_42_15 TaxID=1801742 RepID=A0A1F6VGJ2_9BACT|nr:MAG: hypothetical protein A2738_00045 [Candidatus Nomurabacteria bacterium RIFCSPHIGHO2_01_FULL_42_15]OGI92858.1 MAG: hypothetical protein A3A99_02315 [Candidatus Nomurabacteria bacterium RIFCSPLOWO2_01_FULL_41_18]
MNYLILVIVAIIFFFIGRKTVKMFAPKEAEDLKELQDESRKALAERTEQRKAKILEFMKKEAIHKSELQLCGIDSSRKEFNREDVEKLLDVGGNTARKYLNELEAEGKINQMGETGPDVFYTLKTP